MTDEFRRLLDDGPGAELKRVLESAARDQPSPRALTQAARVLGVGAGGLGLARAAAATAGSRALRASPWGALAKWGGAGILLGGVALSPFVLNQPANTAAKIRQQGAAEAHLSLHQVSSLGPAPTPTRQPQAAAVEPAVPAPAVAAGPPVAAVAAASVGFVTPTTAALRDAVPARAASASSEPIPSAAAQLPLRSTQAFPPASSVPNAPSNVTRPDLLDSEVALLDLTRSALKQGDPNAALALLNRHAQLRVQVLGAEATVLRVQALLAAGRSTEARQVARAALDGQRNLPYAARLRKLAGLVE